MGRDVSKCDAGIETMGAQRKVPTCSDSLVVLLRNQNKFVSNLFSQRSCNSCGQFSFRRKNDAGETAALSAGPCRGSLCRLAPKSPRCVTQCKGALSQGEDVRTPTQETWPSERAAVCTLLLARAFFHFRSHFRSCFVYSGSEEDALLPAS